MKIFRTHGFSILWISIWFTFALFYSQTNSSHQLQYTLQSPTSEHWLGFDAFGRDFLQTVLRASAFSAGFGFIAMILSVLIGITLGTSIALAPTRIRFVLLRSLDIFLAFPSLIIALSWAALRGPGWSTLLISLFIGSIPGFTRLIYSRTRELMVEDYFTAAKALGATRIRIIRKHLAPALFSFSAIKAPNLFAYALMGEATLSFLGVGAPIGRDTWGSLLAQGRDYLIEAPHIALGAGLPLVITIFSLQLLSEKLTD